MPLEQTALGALRARNEGRKTERLARRRLRNAQAWRLCDWLTNHDRSGKIYSGIYRDEELMQGRSKNEATCGVLQASCCLKRSDCCLPPTPVYFLEDSRRFYELLSPVLLLISLTVLQLVSL
ncbi:hypothetical protein LAZ67_X003669 [Cordylochernes scorpioides]|uniref:Uncharacterized protein n=1 Tax=Cordylochernes scorpioides TaxID=51811 RepID=A0ABY6LZ67_9ARAC|nr:hypothetical protein LAZ67_X003669 [Cordylochernes scorpioides]